MSCNWTERISQLIDGELPDHEARAIQRHLNDCLECQHARADFLSFRTEIASYVPSIGSTAHADALHRILGKQKAPSNLAPAKPRLIWGFNPRVAAFATLLLLAAIVGFIVYRAAQTKQSPPVQVANQDQKPVVPTPEVSPIHSKLSDGRQATTGSRKSSETHRIVPEQKIHPREAPKNVVANRVRPKTDVSLTPELVVATDIQSMTAMHLQKAELLLRAFRNVRTVETGNPAEIAYERKQAQQLILRNMVLRREAETAGEIEIATLLENLEPILLDIANLPDEVFADDIDVINERVERKNIVALLQVNSTVLARALED